MQNQNWHRLSVQETLTRLKTAKSGLTEEEARRRLLKNGPNELPQKPPFSRLRIALRQLDSPLVMVLFAAAGISLLLEEFVDAGVILFAVFLNTVVGFMQEMKAEESLAALKKVALHKAYVLRGGIEKELDARLVVAGDVLSLREGDRVPADARVLESWELEADESSLTGESVPVTKTNRGLDQALKDESKKNMVYMGTTVLKGRGLVAVTETGTGTKFGRIALLLKETREEDTPLELELKGFSRSFGWFTFALLIVLMALGLLRGIPFLDIFTASVAIAVAAIPEGVLVAVTIILAIGMQRILKHGSLVRKLVAAETLGSVSLICTDKTGTLTRGEMRLDHIVTSGALFRQDADRVDGDHMTALRIGMLCNDAVVENPEAELSDWVIHGGYTEKAFLLAGLTAGFDPEQLVRDSARLGEIPFNSERKFMATLHKEGSEHVIYVKGAAEEILNRSRHLLARAEERTMREDDLRYFRQKQADMSRLGLRVLGVAYKRGGRELATGFKQSNDENVASDLVFVGLMALKDPLRLEAKATLEEAKKAGIRTIIITGDNALTAKALANELGLRVDEENILEGHQLDQMSTKDFMGVVGRIKVYARVSPRHKSRIVDAWQSRGEVVAMTGDGINDTPALKKADIGIALGSGTEAAKETADLVLLDDDFRTIVTAVREGRAIFDNIRKVVLYLISDSFSEVVIVGGSLLLGTAIPLTAAQILWINLVTDGLPNLALTQEPEEAGLMERKPRAKGEPLFNVEMKALAVAVSLFSGLVALVIFEAYYVATGDYARASSIVFTLLAVDSLVYVFCLRSLKQSVFRQNPFSNPYLILSLVLAFVFQLMALYVPFLRRVLGTQPLDRAEWSVVLAAGLMTCIVIESIKRIFIRQRD